MVDVMKGVRFNEVPKILSISLNRFAFDYSTFSRKNLNDFVSFPLFLNFNNYYEYI